MQLNQGFSLEPHAATAVEEATADWQKRPDLILTFCSTQQPADEIAAEFGARFPGVPMIGCTSTGEHLNGQFLRGSLVAQAIHTPEIRWATALVTDLQNVTDAEVHTVVGQLFEDLQVEADLVNPDEFFCFAFIDGLSKREEVFSMYLADALEGIPVVGGSAGDDLRFHQTHVFHEGAAYSDAAVIALAHTRVPYRLFKHQHFTTTPHTLVVTKAAPEERRVYELDGYPAVEAYARALGLTSEQINNEVTFAHPVIFSYQGEVYVRSIREILPDGSLAFYCAVDEGMVLEIGERHDAVEELESEKQQFLKENGKADWMVWCNCVLRALEAEHEGIESNLESHLAECSQNYIGFDTYGEQLNGLHINQTIVGLAIGIRP